MKKKKEIKQRDMALAVHLAGRRKSGVHQDAERKYRKAKDAYVE